MKTKIFGDKRIIIREFARKDFKNIKKFQDFINNVVEENIQHFLNRKFTLKEEKQWLREQFQAIKNNKVFLIAEHNNKIIGTTCITLANGKTKHIGTLEICIRNGYRRMGLGNYLTREIIKLAKKKLKPKFIRVTVFATNEPALALYKKFHFKKVAQIPQQIRYKGRLIDEIIMIK
jgi:L-phenylalanine/L-methionine N-acetyltransferase